MTQRTNPFGNEVERRPLLGVLGHEHQVQAVEVGSRNVPVEVMGHQVQRVAVGQQSGEPRRDLFALAGADADADVGFLRVPGAQG